MINVKHGDRVVARYGYTGTVTRLYDDFSACVASCHTGDWHRCAQAWLVAQLVPFTDAELVEPWALVSVDTGGALWSPLSLLTPELSSRSP